MGTGYVREYQTNLKALKNQNKKIENMAYQPEIDNLLFLGGVGPFPYNERNVFFYLVFKTPFSEKALFENISTFFSY